MFDNISKNSQGEVNSSATSTPPTPPPPPTNVPPTAPAASGPKPMNSEPEDIFSKVNPGEAPKVEAPRQTPPSLPPKKNKTWLWVILGIVIIILIGVGGYLFFKNLTSQTTGTLPVSQDGGQTEVDVNKIIEDILPEDNQATAPQDNQDLFTEESQPVSSEGVSEESEPPTPIEETVRVDSDGDGLDDLQELNLGTDPDLLDTDGDGLFDGEEVNTYKTNPLNEDTDGDGYLDGQEVSNGYDPNGPGKLLELPTSEETNNSLGADEQTQSAQ